MSSADSPVVYESEVTQVGGQVEAFLGHGLLIFFGDPVPRRAARHLGAAPGDGGRGRAPARRPDPGRRHRAGGARGRARSSATTSSTSVTSTSRPTAAPSPSCPATCASGSATCPCCTWVTPSASRVPATSTRSRTHELPRHGSNNASTRPGDRCASAWSARDRWARASRPSCSGCRGSRCPRSSTSTVTARWTPSASPASSRRTPPTWTPRAGRSRAAAASPSRGIDELGGLPLDIVVEATGVPDVGARVGRRGARRRARASPP